MRRQDRAIEDPGQIREIVEKCACCRLGFWDGGEVYIVPLNYGYEIENGTYVFYFHGAKAGRKYDLIQKKPTVGFELDCDYELVPTQTTCQFTGFYKSIIGTGVVESITEFAEKERGLRIFMEHATHKTGWEFPPAMVDKTEIFKLTVTKMTAKAHQ